jgi:hypothetical protein
VVPVAVVLTELAPPADVAVVGLPLVAVPVPVAVGPAAFPVLLLVGPLVLAVPVVPAVVPFVTGPAAVFDVVPVFPLLPLPALELLLESSLLHAATIRATVTEVMTDARVRLSLDICWSVYPTHNGEQGAGAFTPSWLLVFLLDDEARAVEREPSIFLGTKLSAACSLLEHVLRTLLAAL